MEIIKSKHIGCYGVVLINNEVLLIRKSRGAYTGLLDLPGGGIEYNETAEDTLKREFEEETGLKITNFKLREIVTNYVVWNMSKDKLEELQHIAIIYDVIINEEDYNKIKKESDGLDSLGANWYKIDNLSKEELSPLAKILKK